MTTAKPGKGKRGRPSKADARTTQIQIRVTDAEYVLLAEAAERVDRAMSAWIRLVALGAARKAEGE